MADISRITLPSGTTYDIKDAVARQSITGLTGAMHYGGITTTTLSDGATTATISIDNSDVTLTAANAGTVVINGEKEYVWNGTKWQEFGSTGSLKALAFKDSATVTGTAAAQKFTGTEGSVSVTGAFTAQTVPVTTTTGTATYTPAGDIVDAAFSGTEGNVSVASSTQYMTAASAAIAKDATNGVQISGSVAAPTISVATAGSTTTVPNVTSVGTVPAWSGTVSNETLVISWDAGTAPTLGTAITVKNGDASYSASAPAFTGDKFKVNVTPTTSAVSSTGTFTPAGSVSASFQGIGTRLVTTVAAQDITSTGKFTPIGTNTASAVSGTAS